MRSNQEFESVLETTRVAAAKAEDGEATTVMISISRSLAERIQSRLAKTDFASRDEYAGYILDQVLQELEKLDETGGKAVFSKEEEEEVEKRLADLGYM